MSSYRVGIIGCGGIAHAHAKGYLALGLEIVAAVDVRKEQLARFRQLYEVGNLYDDHRQMLTKEELDLVSICTWPTLHSEMTVDAAEADVKGILCEKPMATCLAEADKMIEACDKTGAKLAIGHVYRFWEAYVEARRLISSNAIGEITFIHGISAGDLLSDGTHIVDLISFFAGDPPVNWVIGQIDAHERRRRYGHYVEDASIFYLEFKNEVRAFIQLSQISGDQPSLGQVGFTEESLFRDLDRARAIDWWKKGSKYCTAHINGTEGRIEVGKWEKPQLRFRRKSDTDWQVPRLEGGSDPIRREIKALIESVERNKEHPCSGRKGRQALEVLMAVFESSRRRETVVFPLNVPYHPLTAMIEKGEV